MSHRLSYRQSDRENRSIKVPSSKMTLAWVQLTKNRNKSKTQHAHTPTHPLPSFTSSPSSIFMAHGVQISTACKYMGV